MIQTLPKVELAGFNNLTKTLSLSVYRLQYVPTADAQQAYLDAIHQQYGAAPLGALLQSITTQIGAAVLNVAQQDYQPQGASATLMVCEGVNQPESLVAHLDKSHMTVHTYPDIQVESGICIFRADIEVATCGLISPLTALNPLLQHFDADVALIDYRIRGFTRDVQGVKHYRDHAMQSIAACLDVEQRRLYEATEQHLAAYNLFHCRLCRSPFALARHCEADLLQDLTSAQHTALAQRLQQELREIYLETNSAHGE